MNAKKKCPICQSARIKYKFSYKNSIKKNGRKWYRCIDCLAFIGEYIEVHNLYKNQYYPSIEYIKERFDYVNSLPDYKSNNHHRVQRLSESIKIYERLGLLKSKERKILDVGCGFGIFLHKFLDYEKTWKGIGLDLDVKLKKFLKSLGIQMIVSQNLSQMKERFDLISFNRVLEHVENPTLLLKKASSILKDDGIIYLEVPDTLSYSLKGEKSESFVDDHYFIFSPKSIFILAEKTNLILLNLSRILEVNNKLTLYAFFSKKKFKNEILH